MRRGYMEPGSTGRQRRQEEIGENEAVTVDDLTDGDVDRVVEHRAGTREGVELAVFAAGIDAARQRIEERGVVGAAGERRIQLTRVDACQPRFEAAVDHLPCEIVRRFRLPERKQRRQAGRQETFFSVAAHVLEEQIAERHVREALLHDATNRGGHAAFVFGVRARPRKRDNVKRQAGGLRLCLQQLPSNRMHGDAVERLVGGRQQAGYGIAILLAQDVEHPRRIFTRRPGGQDFHRVVGTPVRACRQRV